MKQHLYAIITMVSLGTIGLVLSQPTFFKPDSEARKKKATDMKISQAPHEERSAETESPFSFSEQDVFRKNAQKSDKAPNLTDDFPQENLFADSYGNGPSLDSQHPFQAESFESEPQSTDDFAVNAEEPIRNLPTLETPNFADVPNDYDLPDYHEPLSFDENSNGFAQNEQADDLSFDDLAVPSFPAGVATIPASGSRPGIASTNSATASTAPTTSPTDVAPMNFMDDSLNDSLEMSAQTAPEDDFSVFNQSLLSEPQNDTFAGNKGNAANIGNAGNNATNATSTNATSANGASQEERQRETQGNLAVVPVVVPINKTSGGSAVQQAASPTPPISGQPTIIGSSYNSPQTRSAPELAEPANFADNSFDLPLDLPPLDSSTQDFTGTPAFAEMPPFSEAQEAAVNESVLYDSAGFTASPNPQAFSNQQGFQDQNAFQNQQGFQDQNAFQNQQGFQDQNAFQNQQGFQNQQDFQNQQGFSGVPIDESVQNTNFAQANPMNGPVPQHPAEQYGFQHVPQYGSQHGLHNSVLEHDRRLHVDSKIVEVFSCPGAEMVARVGTEVILGCDILPEAKKMAHFEMQHRLKEIPPEERGKITDEMIEQEKTNLVQQVFPMVLDQHLKTMVLYCEFASMRKKEEMQMIEKKIGDVFDDKELPQLMKQFEADSRVSLNQKLEQYIGSSIEREKMLFFRKYIGHITLSDIIKEAEGDCTHDEMSTYYQEHRSDFFNKGKVKWTQLSVHITSEMPEAEARKKITWMGNQVVSGAPFAIIAKNNSDGPTAKSGGDWDWTTQGALASDVLEKALFQNQIGVYSPILQDRMGFHIIKVVERQDEHFTPFLESQAKIRAKIKEQRRNKREAELFTELYRKFQPEKYQNTVLDSPKKEVKTIFPQLGGTSLHSREPGTKAAGFLK